jgi:UDP-N-acetylmuramoyl-tripeptide--D-alanyl-D-alanine ligase
MELSSEAILTATGAEVVGEGEAGRPERTVIDSREAGAGALFFGLRGEHADGGEFAAAALASGAWGAVVARERAAALADDAGQAGGWVLAVADPLVALQRLATAWRRELDCPVVGITGSTGKTSVKDICRGLLPMRVHASPENYNTEIGLPLAILAAPAETEVLVLEMAMRGKDQIAELCEIAEPDVGAITNVGPVHLELLGTLEAIAEAKAEILTGLAEGGRAIVPVDAEALEPHLDDRLDALTFGPGGDVFATDVGGSERALEATIATPDGEARFAFPFGEAHNLTNALCAVAIGVSLGATPADMAPLASRITFSRLRGEMVDLAGGIVLVNDCYNANPVSMRAALDHLASLEADGRHIAVLGEMRELGPDAEAYHREVAAHARGLGIGPIIGVGELGRAYAPDAWAADAQTAAAELEHTVRPGDAVLVKGSRTVGLELVADELMARHGDGGEER